MKHSLKDLIDIDLFQNLQNRLNEIYSFHTAIVDIQGNILTSSPWQDICRQFHRKNSECRTHCLESDQYILKHLKEADPAVVYHCPHGLVDCAAPIIIEGVHYGNFFTGQFFMKKPDLEFFREQARKYGFDEKEYIKAVKKVPVCSRKLLDSYMFIIRGLITIITENGLKTIRESGFRQQIDSVERHSTVILQTAMDGFWLVNDRGFLQEANDSYSRMSGYSPGELKGMHIKDLEGSETPEVIQERIRRIAVLGQERFYSRHRRKDGGLYEVELSVKYLPGETGLFCVFIRDISEKKKTENSLEETGKRLELAAVSTHLGIWDWDLLADRLVWDEQMYRLYGLDRRTQTEQMELWRKCIHPDDLDFVLDTVQKAVRGETQYDTEFRIRLPDGELRYIKADGTVMFDESGKAVRMIGINRDITAQKEAEQELKEAKVFLDSMSDIAYIIDSRGILVWVNAPAEKVTGIPVDHVIGKPFLPLFVQEEHESALSVYQRTLKGESLEIILTFRTGVTCQFTSLPKYSSTGEIIGVFGIARDITGMLAAEKALQVSESRLLRAQQVAKIGNWEFDVSTEKIWGSEEAFRIYGLERTDGYLSIEDVLSRIVGEDSNRQALKNLVTKRIPYDIEFAIQSPDREEITYIRSVAELVCDTDDRPVKVQGVIQDITETKLREKEKIALKEQLLQAQKLDSIGQLAGGIAHDFNNQLSGILGYAEMLASSLQDPQLREYAENICLAVENGARLTQQLLSFARKGQYTLNPINLYDICDEVIGMLEHTIDKRIRILQERLIENPVVLGDRHQIQNAILNISLNARDAISGKGTILFECTRIHSDGMERNPRFELNPGDYICLSIKDDGCGMDASVLQHIFDPFYTTKEVGKGTGMGLPAAFGAVKHHGGGILVESVPSLGSTFHILLPESRAGVPVRKTIPAGEMTQGYPLVDDDEMLRVLISEFLESLGYRVHTAENGQKGLDYFRKHRREIGLVILDLIMPEMGGEELLEHLKAADPGVKTLVSSGYSHEEKSIQKIIRQGTPFLQKPVSLGELSWAVAELLEKSDSH